MYIIKKKPVVKIIETNIKNDNFVKKKVLNKKQNIKIINDEIKDNSLINNNVNIIENIITLNKGEVGEILTIKKLFKLSQENDNEKLVKIFGEDAIDGITIHNIVNKKIIENISEIRKTNCTSKADCIIKFITAGTILNDTI